MVLIMKIQGTNSIIVLVSSNQRQKIEAFISQIMVILMQAIQLWISFIIIIAPT